MGGIFGTISKKSCVADLFYGTDYNSHLGTRRGGMATYSEDKGFVRSIHNLESSYFRSKFEASLNKFDAMYLRLYYYTGGTMRIICQADAPMNIAYIRMACLKDDYELFANKQVPSFAKMKVVDTSVWSEELHQALTSVKYETQDKELIESCGSESEYKQQYCQLEKYAIETKTLLARWVTQRRNAEQLLSDSQQGNYRNHTLMTYTDIDRHIYG